MNIARLNEKVTIQKSVVRVDPVGNHRNEWEDYFTCHATIGNEGRSERSEITAAGDTVDHTDMDVTVRFSQKTASVTSTGFRVMFRGEIYDILAVDHMNFARKAVKLRCKKAAR